MTTTTVTTQAELDAALAARWVRCTVALADLRPIVDGGTAKAKCRSVRVEAEVDRNGRNLPAAKPAETTVEVAA